MKIVHLIESNRVSYGGPAFGLARIVDNYPSDVEVTIIVTGNTFLGPEVEINKNVCILKSQNRSSILSHLIKGSYDLAIVHGVWRSELFLVGLVSIFKKMRIFIFTHGMLDPFFLKPQQPKWFKKWLFHKLLQGPILKLYKHVLCTSEVERQKLVSTNSKIKEKFIDVGYGINESEIVFADNFEHIPSVDYIVFMSRLHEKKGIEILVKAYGEVKDPKFDLVICGAENKYYEETIEPLINKNENRDRIHFLGQQTGRNKWSTLSQARYMVLPSFQENFGVVIAEALAVGTPVILGKDLDIAEIVRSEKCGYLVSPNAAEIANLLVALNWDEMATPSAQTCKTVFQKHFHMSRVTKKILELAKL